MLKYTVVVLVLAIVSEQCMAQNLILAYNSCSSEFNVDMEAFNALKNGDFSNRTPLIECFGDCIVKKAGFMREDLSFNKDTIVKFVARFIKPADAGTVYEKCTSNVTPTLCVTAYDVYQCIYENTYSKWGTRINW
ncbi:general odorant-binding protein 56d-like [Toxorhynchites rutilus septentrionalis]|uniref:general odorant-binding protein 56d-like n=1 Tax=Toxorhynchites rutilus septentrionalis TaxID=329112 RepID=UPI002478D4A1|nr:general odorant-binding protein 56d-like [Toxorhynchites rutilus septentrionalis]